MKYSYIYGQQLLYRLMLMNVRTQIIGQNNALPNNPDNFNIFEVTSVIGMALEIPKETVMSDYMLLCKTLKE